MILDNIISALLILIFSISSTGVVVYEHHCSRSGSHVGFFTDVEHNCGNDEVKDHCKSEQSSICCENSKKPTDSRTFEEKCCTTNVSLVQIESEYTSEQIGFSFENSFVFELDVTVINLFEKEQSTDSGRDPPDLKLSQARRRALLQRYLI